MIYEVFCPWCSFLLSPDDDDPYETFCPLCGNSFDPTDANVAHGWDSYFDEEEEW